MTVDELNDEQRIELKQRILEDRNEHLGEGTSYEELANADELVDDEVLEAEYGGTKFSPDDFSCSAGSAGTVHEVRVTWPVSRTYRVWAKSPEDAVREMRERIDAGQVCVWTDSFEADDDVSVEAVDDAQGRAGLRARVRDGDLCGCKKQDVKERT